MHPILVHLGPITIHTYGFLIAAGFLTALEVVRRNSIRAKLDAERILDLSFWILVLGFIGARALFVITRWNDFLADPLAILRVWEGGLVFLGGPLAGMPLVVWYTRRYKIPVWRAMDAMIPGLVIAHAFGRFGCLSAGCCYGKPTGANWGIKLYSELVEPALHGIPLHPTQLYEAVALLILFAGLTWIFRRKHFDGQVILSYFIAYPVIRSIIEIYRGDLIRGFVIPGVLSTSQFISIWIFLAATGVLIWRLKQIKPARRSR